MSNNKTSLGDYVKNVFDLNKDGTVTVKEFISTLVPSQAVAIALLVVDLLALVGEYRVYQIAMVITDNNFFAAMGFVAVSLVPFYLAQVLWLYPLASGWQQFIAVIMGGAALYTSVTFGLADLSKQYDTVFLSKVVVYLWLLYIVLLLLYVLLDKQFKLMRAKITARANTAYQKEMNQVANSILADLEESLTYEQQLRARFGDDAVDAHIAMLQARNGKKQPNQRPVAPPLPAPSNNGSGPQQQPSNPTNPPPSN